MSSFKQQPFQFTRFSVVDSQQVSSHSVAKKFMSTVFLWMFIGLGVSALFALLFANNDLLREQLYVITYDGIQRTGLGTLVAFAPLAFVLIMTFGFGRISAPVLTIMFLVFASLMGMSLSVWLWTFKQSSVISCFASASAMFGIMAVMGYTTDKDLTKFGSLLYMALIGVIVAGMINFFIGSAGFEYVISLLTVLIFTGITAYNVQSLKKLGSGIATEGVSSGETKKLALIGALNLYMTFINIFINLLNIFGDRD